MPFIIPTLDDGDVAEAPNHAQPVAEGQEGRIQRKGAKSSDKKQSVRKREKREREVEESTQDVNGEFDWFAGEEGRVHGDGIPGYGIRDAMAAAVRRSGDTVRLWVISYILHGEWDKNRKKKDA